MAAKKHAERKSGWKSAFLTGIIVFVLFSLLLFARRLDYDLFIANKAVALAAVVLIGLSFLIGPLARLWPRTWKPRLYLRKYLGVFGFAIAALHALISLILLSPAYYPKLFTAAGKLTQTGEFSMLFGVLAVFIFSVVSVTSLPSVQASMHPKQWLFIQRIGYIAFVVVFLHFFVLKWQGWINPANYINGLPPASLIGALFIVFVIVMRVLVIGRRQR